MKLRFLTLTAIAVLATAGPVLAQSQGNRDSNGSRTSAGGSSVSGRTASSSASIKTSGDVDVGVIQGTVTEGGTVNQAPTTGGTDTTGGGAETSEIVSPTNTNAVNDGIVADLNLPAMNVGDEAANATRTRPDVVTWAIAGVIIAGLALLYTRLPRASAR